MSASERESPQRVDLGVLNYHYVAFVWDPLDIPAAEVVVQLSQPFRVTLSGWTCAVETEGLLALHRPPADGSRRAYVLPEGGGVVLGRLFRRTPGPTSTTDSGDIRRTAAIRMLHTRGHSLVDDYWGQYVAFLYDAGQRLHHVVRDPSGQVPCLWLHVGRVQVFFSDLADVLTLKDSSPSINWSSVTAFLLNEGVRLRETGIDEVTELFAGERLSVNGRGVAHEPLWDPAAICAEGSLEHIPEATRQLRQVTESCIQAWAARSADVLLSLSGGFDSAVILACLARAAPPPHIHALNRYTPQPGEDERRYARLAALRADIELTECEWGVDGVSLERLIEMTPITARPSVQSVSALEITARGRIAKRVGAATIWTGQGGDHLFFQMRTALSAADHLQRRGVTRGWLRTMREAARLARKSYVSVLTTAVSSRLFRAPRQATITVDAADTFLAPAVAQEGVAPLYDHPWVTRAMALPPGKRLQVSGLVDLVHRPSPCAMQEEAPDFHPLISQPLIETCLRIPIDVLLLRGRTRGLAREAFRDVLPCEIVERESKGSMTSYFVRIIRENAQGIRALLLDGMLASRRLLDRRRVDACLVQGQPLRPEQLYPLLACVTAEIWLRSLRQRTY